MIPYFSTIDTPLEIMLYGSVILLSAVIGLALSVAEAAVIRNEPSSPTRDVIGTMCGAGLCILFLWFLIGDSVNWSVAINNWMMGRSTYDWMIGR